MIAGQSRLKSSDMNQSSKKTISSMRQKSAKIGTNHFPSPKFTGQVRLLCDCTFQDEENHFRLMSRKIQPCFFSKNER